MFSLKIAAAKAPILYIAPLPTRLLPSIGVETPQNITEKQ